MSIRVTYGKRNNIHSKISRSINTNHHHHQRDVSGLDSSSLLTSKPALTKTRIIKFTPEPEDEILMEQGEIMQDTKFTDKISQKSDSNDQNFERHRYNRLKLDGKEDGIYLNSTGNSLDSEMSDHHRHIQSDESDDDDQKYLNEFMNFRTSKYNIQSKTKLKIDNKFKNSRKLHSDTKNEVAPKVKTSSAARKTNTKSTKNKTSQDPSFTAQSDSVSIPIDIKSKNNNDAINQTDLFDFPLDESEKFEVQEILTQEPSKFTGRRTVSCRTSNTLTKLDKKTKNRHTLSRNESSVIGSQSDPDSSTNERQEHIEPWAYESTMMHVDHNHESAIENNAYLSNPLSFSPINRDSNAQESVANNEPYDKNTNNERQRWIKSEKSNRKHRDSLDSWLESNLQTPETVIQNMDMKINPLNTHVAENDLQERLAKVSAGLETNMSSPDKLGDISLMLNEPNPVVMKGRIAKLKKNNSPTKKLKKDETLVGLTKVNETTLATKTDNTALEEAILRPFPNAHQKISSVEELSSPFKNRIKFNEHSPKYQSSNQHDLKSGNSKPLFKISNTKITYGQTRSYLSNDNHGGFYSDNQKSLATRMREEGLESSEDEEEGKGDVKGIHELREAGEMKRFSDEMEYILDGLNNDQTLNVRRTSCMSLVKKLLSEKFISKIQTYGYLSLLYTRLSHSNDPIFQVLQILCFNLLLEDTKISHILASDVIFLNLLVSGLKSTIQDPLITIPKTKYDKRMTLDIKSLIRETNIFDEEIRLDLYLLSITCLSKLLNSCHHEDFKRQLVDLEALHHIVAFLSDTDLFMDTQQSSAQADEITADPSHNSTLIPFDRYAKHVECSIMVLDAVTCMNSYSVGYLFCLGSFVDSVSKLFKGLELSRYTELTTSLLKLFVNLSNDKQFSLDMQTLFDSVVLSKVNTVLWLSSERSTLRNVNEVVGNHDGTADFSWCCLSERNDQDENMKILDLKLLACGLWMNLLEHDPQHYISGLIQENCDESLVQTLNSTHGRKDSHSKNKLSSKRKEYGDHSQSSNALHTFIGTLIESLTKCEEIPECKIFSVYLSLLLSSVMKVRSSTIKELQNKMLITSSHYQQMTQYLKDFLSFGQLTSNPIAMNDSGGQKTSHVSVNRHDGNDLLGRNTDVESPFDYDLANGTIQFNDFYEFETKISAYERNGDAHDVAHRKDKLMQTISEAIELFSLC